MNFLLRRTKLSLRSFSWSHSHSRQVHLIPVGSFKKPQLWLNEKAADEEWYEDDTEMRRMSPEVTVQTLHLLIREGKFALADQVRRQLEGKGIDIPHSMLYIRAAFGELNTLSPATAEAFYAWLRLIPARDELPRPKKGHNPFLRFDTLYRSGKPIENIPVVFMLAKIASSKGYFFAVFKRFMSFTARLVTPDSGMKMIMELQKSAVDYELRVAPDYAKQQAALIRSMIVIACCQANWMKEAANVIHSSDLELLPAAREVYSRKQWQIRPISKEERRQRRLSRGRRSASTDRRPEA